MSDDALALIITAAVLLLLFLWVPTLHLCDRCFQRLFRKPLPESTKPAARPASVAKSKQAA